MGSNSGCQLDIYIWSPIWQLWKHSRTTMEYWQSYHNSCCRQHSCWWMGLAKRKNVVTFTKNMASGSEVSKILIHYSLLDWVATLLNYVMHYCKALQFENDIVSYWATKVHKQQQLHLYYPLIWVLQAKKLIHKPPRGDEPECSVKTHLHCEHEIINSQNIYINLHCGISLLHPGTTI